MEALGVWLLIALFGWLIWLALKRYRSSGNESKPDTAVKGDTSALAAHKKMLAVLEAQDQNAPVFTWPRDCGAETDVVGESHYIDTLTSIVGKAGDKTRSVDVSAALIPYDFKPGEKAVGVVIKGQLVGHLARDEVDLYLETLERQGQAGKVTQCKATASGRRIDGRPVYWVKLDLDVMAGDNA